MRKVPTGFLICLTSLLLLSAVVHADLYNRAPDVLPGTIPEMRDPEFWIARMGKPDEVVLSPEVIQQMNENYKRKVSSPDPFRGVSKERMPKLAHWWPGFEMVIPDLSTFTPKEVADTVRVKIQREIDFLRGRPYGNALAVEYADWEIDKFVGEMALDLVGNSIEIKHGIAVTTARLRNIPSFFPMQVGLWENGKTRWDLFSISILKIAKPVTILHSSRSGEYLFVLCGEGYGWVRSVDIAMGTRERVDQFANPENFVVCTDNRVMFYSDESCEYASGYFRMGDRLPLTEDNNTRKISVPVRTSYGALIAGRVWLAEDADVSVGWLPYTRRNIVTTAFKLLDEPFDWTGAWFGRNAEAPYRDIFACFGFELPFHGNLFTHFGNTERVAFPPTGKGADTIKKSAGNTIKVDYEAVKDMYNKILENEPFLTIQTIGGSGHSQLLLGEYEGEPYVFDCHGYGYTGEDGTEYEIRRCVIENMGMGVPVYALPYPIVFCELK